MTATWANSGGNGEKCSGRQGKAGSYCYETTPRAYGAASYTCTAVSLAREVILVFNHILSYAVLYLLVCILDSPGTVYRWTVRESTGFAVVSVSEYYAWCWIQVVCQLKHVSRCHLR